MDEHEPTLEQLVRDIAALVQAVAIMDAYLSLESRLALQADLIALRLRCIELNQIIWARHLGTEVPKTLPPTKFKHPMRRLSDHPHPKRRLADRPTKPKKST